MAAPAPGTAPAKRQSGGLGSTLSQKMGPLPVWAWLAILTVAGLLWWLVAQRKGGTPAGGTASVPETVIDVDNPAPPSPPPPSPPPPGPKLPPQQPGPHRHHPPHGPHPTGHEPKGKAHYKFVDIGGRATSQNTVQQWAQKFGMTEQELVKLNPGLHPWVGSGKPVSTPMRLKVRANLKPGSQGKGGDDED